MDWRHRAARAPVRLVAARAWLRMVAEWPLAGGWLLMVAPRALACLGRCVGVRWRLRGLPDT